MPVVDSFANPGNHCTSLEEGKSSSMKVCCGQRTQTTLLILSLLPMILLLVMSWVCSSQGRHNHPNSHRGIIQGCNVGGSRSRRERCRRRRHGNSTQKSQGGNRTHNLPAARRQRSPLPTRSSAQKEEMKNTTCLSAACVCVVQLYQSLSSPITFEMLPLTPRFEPKYPPQPPRQQPG